MEAAIPVNLRCTCGQVNPDGSLYCRGCHALLVVDADEALPLEGCRLLDLADACERLLQGHWELAAFHAWLDAFTEMQQGRAGDIHRLYAQIPTYLEDDFQDEYEIGTAGLERCEEALTLLAAAAITRATVLRAIRLYLQGTCEILDAMAVNRRNAARPLWA